MAILSHSCDIWWVIPHIDGVTCRMQPSRWFPCWTHGELELISTCHPRAKSTSSANANGQARGHTDMIEGEPLGEDDDIADGQGLGGEPDDAIIRMIMTDLKLQVCWLKRDLEAATMNQVDASCVLVLENLLEDANRMKARYEVDCLAAP